MNQLGLPLAWPADPREDAFLVTPATARAAALLDKWGAWQVSAVLLVGPRKSGRTLLARIFAAKTGGDIIDDVEQVPETAVFHAWNRAQERHRPLVMIADAPPPDWQIALPDLASRIAATPIARIEDPDAGLVRALLDRQFQRRGIDARDDVLDWLTARLERSHVAVQRVVDELDHAVLEQRRRLSVPLARATLRAAALIDDPAADEEIS